MRKRRNPNPSQPTYNLEDEINTTDYPYYRDIPIKHIANKQHQMLDRYKTVENTSYKDMNSNYVYSQPSHSLQVYNGPPVGQLPVYKGPPVGQLPVYDLVRNPEDNTYSINMKSMEERIEDMRKEIDVNSEKLKEQSIIMASNTSAIENQVYAVNAQNASIQSNGALIQQQVQVYNHNLAIINQQYYTINTYNAEIATHTQTLDDLKAQTEDTHQQLTQMEQDVNSYQQQLLYHGSMLSAFNTMLQNPEYFAQLMSMSVSACNPHSE